jgi:hypothetical protein
MNKYAISIKYLTASGSVCCFTAHDVFADNHVAAQNEGYRLLYADRRRRVGKVLVGHAWVVS